jgi:PTS system nitrogen regulatory IIA component
LEKAALGSRFRRRRAASRDCDNLSPEILGYEPGRASFDAPDRSIASSRASAERAACSRPDVFLEACARKLRWHLARPMHECPGRDGNAVKLTVREAARLLSVSESEIYRWIDDGDIPCHVVNHQPLFSRAELLEWATAHRRPLSTELFDDGGAASSLAAALERGGVHAGVAGDHREGVLRAVVEHLPIPDPGERELVLAVMLAREKDASTAIGDGIAIPHVRSPVVFAGVPAVITVCYLEHPVLFEAPEPGGAGASSPRGIDGKPVEVVFAIMTPTIRAHLQLLSRLSLALLDPDFKRALADRALLDELVAHARRIEAALAASPDRRAGHHDGSAE